MAAIERENIDEWLTSRPLWVRRYAAGHVVILCPFVLLAPISWLYGR